MNSPKEISLAEWKEIMRLPIIRESWGLQEDERPEEVADRVFGVKFDFASGIAPGYVGDLYILHGDALGEPVVVIRHDGELAVAN